jgi:hypothetical protein
MLNWNELTQDQNKALVERYPFLIPRNVWTGKVAEDCFI